MSALSNEGAYLVHIEHVSYDGLGEMIEWLEENHIRFLYRAQLGSWLIKHFPGTTLDDALMEVTFEFDNPGAAIMFKLRNL